MRINWQKVIERIEEIYSCGKLGDGSYSRVAYSPEDVKGREKFIGYFKALGIEPKIDEAGNIIARLEGKDAGLPSIVVGSHLDTVPDGGKYDGVLGCLAGLGVCEALIESGERLNHPLEVIVFTDEEGARFGSGMIGSAAFSSIHHELADDDIDIFGMPRREVYEAFGIDTATLPRAARPSGTVRCFIELHIEQGGLLHKNKIPIGVVTSIAGVKRYEITVKGESNHAGSTMMADRKDSLVAAAKFIAAVPEVVAKHGKEYSVGTVGVIRVTPGSVNVIPGECVFSLEIRDQSAEIMDALEARLKELLEEICAGYEMSFRQITTHAPAPMADWIKDLIKESCEKLNYQYLSMPSGAFHDSLLISSAFPTGMIFIPSIGGISHSPMELSADADIEAGCNVLLQTVLAADKRNY